MADDQLTGLRIDKTKQGRSRLRGRAVLWWLAGAVALIMALSAARGGLFPRVEVETTPVSLIYPSQSFTELNASGYVVPQRKAAVAAKSTGRLVWLGVEEGRRVRAGEVIARLESDDVAATRDQAAANLANARAVREQATAEQKDATRGYERNRELLAVGVVSQAELDASEARYRKALAALKASDAAIEVARATLASAEVAVGYTQIRAPFDAVVLTKDADVGDIVTPLGAAANAKAAVVTMADMATLQVEADVSESSLGKIRVGQPCEIQLDALPESRFPGTVHMVMPTADRSKGTVLVKVRFNSIDSRILPQMSAKVAFLKRPVAAAEKKPRLAVSPAALVHREGRTLLYLVKGDRAAATAVTTGERLGDLVELTAGAAAGDKAVLKPLDKMKDGVRIRLPEK